METIKIYLTTDNIKEKILTIRALSTLNDICKPEEIDRDTFPVYLSNERFNRVAVNISFDTFYSLTRLCQINQ